MVVRGALLALITLVASACSEQELGSAAPPVPVIDVCVKAAPDAATEVCYSDEKQRRQEELCAGEGECLLPELTADLGRVMANATGGVTVTVKNNGQADLVLYNPTVAPGSSNRYRLDPAQRPGHDVYLEIPGKKDKEDPAGEAQFEVQLRGSVCGAHQARLVLTSNDGEFPPNSPTSFEPGQPDSPIYLDVSGFVGGPCLCALPPSQLDYGDVPVGATKKRRFSFENCGDEDLTVSDTSIGVNSINGDVFALDATLFPPGDVLTAGAGEQAHIDVTYTPGSMSPPPDDGELWIYTNAPTSQPYHLVPLSGKGVPRPSCILAAIPSEASFGVVDGTRDRSFRLFNNGQIACRLFDVQRTSGSADFVLTGGVPSPSVTLQPNQSHDIVITYGPSDDQFDEAVFTATADDIDGYESIATISVTGNPTLPDDGCILDIQPDFGDFGDVTVGQTVAMDFVISNVADGIANYCNISNVQLTAGAPDFRLGDLGGFIGGIILPGLDSSMTVFFEPETEGTKIGILHFASNDAMSPGRDIQLWGNALGARICVDPTGGAPATVQCGPTQPCATVDYGMTTSEAIQDVTLTNCGAGTLRVRGINMDPAGGLAFIKTAPAAQDLPIELAAGQSTQVQIKYRPTNQGGDFGAFDVLSNAANNQVARVALRGNYDGDCPSIIRCTPDPMVMGSHEVGVAAVQTAVCSNFGTDTFWVNNVTMSGDSSLSIVSSSTGELASGDSFVVQVQCFPQNPGMKNGTVAITSDACDAPQYSFDVSCNGIDLPISECIGADTFEPYEMWRWTGTPDYPGWDDVWMTPVVINLTDDNGDGAVDVLDTPDVIFTAFNSNMNLFGGGGNTGEVSPEQFCRANDPQPSIVVAVSGDTGEELWSWGTLPAADDPEDPNALAIEAESTLAAADIDADGLPEIIGIKYIYYFPPNCSATDPSCCLFGKYSYGRLIALEHDGSFKWESDTWHQPESVGENAAAISIGDMNGDGIPEIAMGNAVFDNNGILLFEGLTQSEGELGHGEGGAGHGAISAFVDLDVDGTNELVAGRTAFDWGGGVVWNRRDLSDGLVTIANLDADDNPEIVLFGGNNDLYVLEHDGTTKYGPKHVHSGNFDDNGNEEGFIATNPAIGDIDGDGYPEIVVAATNNLWAFEHNLADKWSASIDDQTGASGPTTFDFEGDGKAEVLHADENSIQMFDGITGNVKYTAARGSRTIVDNPVVVDVDNDGHADILVSLENPMGDLGMYGLIAYSNAKNNWVGTRRVWNQHGYHITNISESGVVPAFEGAGWLEHNVYRSNVIYCQ